MKLVGCVAVVKNEQEHIAEWIAYQFIVGFDTVIIFDNGSTDSTRAIIDHIALTYDVRVLDWFSTDAAYQVRAYEVAAKQFSDEFEWLAFFDSDEFLAIEDGSDFRKILANRIDSAAIAVSWAFFGSSGHRSRPEGLVIEKFIRRSEISFAPNRHIKSIVRPTKIVRCVNAHYFVVNGLYTNFIGDWVEWALDGLMAGEPSYEVGKLNHYFTRSLQHWKLKIARGYHDAVRNSKDFIAYDRNEIHDNSAARHAAEVRRYLGSMGAPIVIEDGASSLSVGENAEIDKEGLTRMQHRIDRDPPFRYSVVACARWEERYIVEWLNYYRSIGFDHVFLYCNDDEPSALYQAVLPFTLGPEPFVTFHYFPLQGQQHLMYMHFLHHYKQLTEWFSFLDIDEFLRLTQHRTIGEYIAAFPGEPDAIHFNWCFFGNNGFDQRPEGSVLLNYTKRFPGFYNRMTKHITRSAMIDPDLIHRGMSTDFWHYWNGIENFRDLKLVNVLGEDMHGYYDDPEATDRMLAEPGRYEAYLDRAIINHYVYKSREDFLIRARRGTNSVFAQQAWYEQAYHSGQVDQVMERLNQVEDRLLADRWAGLLAGGIGRNVFAAPAAPLISQGKMAMQSSVCEHSRAASVSKDAAGAVDGVIDGDYSFHTDIEDAPWWLVDLDGLHEIAEVRLFNRVDRRSMAARANRIRIEVSALGRDWVEVLRKDDEFIFGGADGDPLIWRATAPITARYVRVSLLQRNPLHLDQVQVFGRYVGLEADRPLDEADTRDPPTAPVEERAVLERFQSLGNTCEFGLVQKNAGVGGLGLLRWSATSPESLMLGLADDFRLMGEPENVELTDHRGEYFWTDRTYFVQSHTFIPIEGSDQAKVLAELTSRSRFLRRKFSDDLSSGEPIWVFHVHKDYEQPKEEAVRRLADALAARGPNLLFWVVPAYIAGRTPGEVEWVGPNLLKGYGGLHSALDGKPLSARAQWLALCRAALALVDARGGRDSVAGAASSALLTEAAVSGPSNLALGRPALQSSISPWSRRPDVALDAAGAVDGRITGEVKFHTDIEDHPWWQVDLGAVFGISGVKLYNRMDDPNVVHRSAHLAIEVGFRGDDWVEVYRRKEERHFGGIDGKPLVFAPVMPVPGRFVRVRLLRRDYLHLDQVEVFGEALPGFG
ncbi:MAG: hypothetical protein B7X48_08230 [Acidiphilium sp. 34-60-192]|nr:MAG: hypothetical protein B7X48_08230 [Acidiphilium sp. 34-60-192]